MKALHIPRFNATDLSVLFLGAYRIKSTDLVIDLFDENGIYRDNFHKLGGKANLKLFFESFFEEEFIFKSKEIKHVENDALINFDFDFGGNKFPGQILLNFNDDDKVSLMWLNFHT
jgi:hypothetical protein